MARDEISKRMLGRTIATLLLVQERLRMIPLEDRRLLVQRALADLAKDDLARQSEAVFDEARKTLIAMLKK